jgi:DNA helicase-2/ATP-dependent DNA helicase PcrA
VVDFIAELNPEQQKAVKITNGPILILAGAGSGKTRVITYRIAYLIHQKRAEPFNILAITFTNKAADEMKTRIFSLLNGSHAMWIRTFHSTCARILRDVLHRDPKLHKPVGVNERFVIYDEQDQLALIKSSMKDLDINPHDYPPQMFCDIISRYKEQLRPTSAVTNEPSARIYRYYNEKLREYNALDFDDLIMKVVELFRTESSVLKYYQDRFKYILVDEYQDTNRAQYVFTKMLAEKHRNICVVGDDDQSIYSWRGAEIRNILDFEKDFPETKVIKLEQNYRSTKTILSAASAVVKRNEFRKPKVLWCDNEEGERLEFFSAMDAYNEAAFVARKVIEQKLQNVDLGDIAVFYRINYQSRVFEDCFIRFQIPYIVVGALKFYERAEIKNVLAYLRTINNPRDTVSLLRIINIPPRKIGHRTVEKVEQYSAEHMMTFYEALHHIDSIDNIAVSTKRRIKAFVDMLDALVKERDKLNLYELALRVVRDSGYLESFDQERSEREFIRRKNVEELLISIKEYAKQRPNATLDGYLEDVSLRSEIDEWNASSSRVNLMTLHNAKGLEFDTVFITGLEDGLIPHHRSQHTLEEYEEERRLLYVGITRARKKLFLTCAQQRDMLRGGTMFTSISPFFKELPEEAFATTLEGSGLDIGN